MSEEKTVHSPVSLHRETVKDDLTSDDLAAHGALLEDDERHLTMIEILRLHWRPALVCTVSFTSAMVFGYDSIANGATLSMPAFVLHYGEVGLDGPFLPSMWTSLWAAMSALAQGVGAFIVGFFMDRFGRKYVGSAFASITIAGTALQFYSTSRGMLLAGKGVSGLGLGAGLAVGTTYASEIAPLRLRAPIQQGIVLFTLAMYALGMGVVRAFVPNMTPSAFKDVFAIQWGVGGISTIAWLLVPESPVFLLTKQKLDPAEEAMKKIFGPGKSADLRVALLDRTIREEQARMSLESGSYLDCFKGTDRKRTLTVIFLYSAMNWGGAAFLAQSMIILTLAGLPAVHVYDISIGGFALAVLIIIGNWLLMAYYRRHNAFLFGCIINLLFTAVIGGLYYVPGQSGLWATAVLMNLLTTLQSAFIQGMGYPIAAELSSYRLRGKTMSIATISQALSNWLTSFVVPYMYNVDSGNLGIRTGFVFAGISVLLVIGAWFLVPDTTNLTAKEIDELYVHHCRPRDFQRRTRND